MLKAFRGEILHFLNDPSIDESESYEYYEDGTLVIENGRVHALGETNSVLAVLPEGTEITHYKDGLIVPGFIDTHIHYPQTEMVASYGEQLLEWLETYTFPEESKFADFEHAKRVAEFFLSQLLASGTTTALVFGTVHSTSVDAFFGAAQARNLRMICGKVLMDRNCPEYLQDCAESGYSESKALIEKWHNVDRLQYAVTPRFAPTSSEEQLLKAGKPLAEYSDVYLHTHLSENTSEIEWVKSLFPDSTGYLDVYDQKGLLGRRSIFAHGVHLCDEECQRLHDAGSAIAFCPTSNMFLGSGCFNLKQAESFNIHVGMGTDIGAGTSFSMLSTLNEAYKTQQLRGYKLHPLKMLYLATLGGARALDLEGTIGNFVLGAEADFVVLDYNGTALMANRIKRCSSLEDKLFALSMLGDDRHVRSTYIMGNKVEMQ